MQKERMKVIISFLLIFFYLYLQPLFILRGDAKKGKIKDVEVVYFFIQLHKRSPVLLKVKFFVPGR